MPKVDDPVANARSITSSLQRSASTMTSTVSTANVAVNSLAEDGDIIRETLDEHKYGLKKELQESKKKLNRVQSAGQREKWMIWSSVSFFTAVVFYIIAKRMRLLALLSLLGSGVYNLSQITQQLYGWSPSALDKQDPIDTYMNTQAPQSVLNAPAGVEVKVEVDGSTAGGGVELLNAPAGVEVEVEVDGSTAGGGVELLNAPDGTQFTGEESTVGSMMEGAGGQHEATPEASRSGRSLGGADL